MLIVMAGLIAGEAYHVAVFGQVGNVTEYFGEGASAGLFFVLLMSSRGMYRASMLIPPTAQFRPLGGGWIAAILILIGFLFLLKSPHHSRGALIIFALLGAAVIIGWRALLTAQLRQALAKGQVTGRRVVLIGDTEELARISGAALLQDYGSRDLGRFSLSSPTLDAAVLSPGDSATLDEAIRAVRTRQATTILLALRWNNERRRRLICERLRVLPMPVLLLPDRASSTLLTRPLRQLGTCAAVELQRAPLSSTEMLVKRGTDLFLAVLGLTLLLPLLVIVAIAVKFDSPGPVIFKQRRRGFSGREFTIYKFRTMTVLEDGPVVRQAERNDRRVTRLGRILRRTSIDELPQLLNVLLGDMSFVGPRPHAVAHDDKYCACISHYAFRSHVKPGLTGWAQVHGLRGETAQMHLMNARVDYDIWYINNWSLWLDLWVIARTFTALFANRNVY
jgi:Undecaprenyl-phosphate glucose phosphotransferase